MRTDSGLRRVLAADRWATNSSYTAKPPTREGAGADRDRFDWVLASTTVLGSCDAGITTYVPSSGGSVSSDPSIGARCSPISAVAGTTTGTGSGAMMYCTMRGHLRPRGSAER